MRSLPGLLVGRRACSLAFAPTRCGCSWAASFVGICGALRHRQCLSGRHYGAGAAGESVRHDGGRLGLGFIIDLAIGGLLGAYGPRVPFFVAAGLAALNFVYGYLVLPETLPPEKRRAFSRSGAPIRWGRSRSSPSTATLCRSASTVRPYFLATAVYPALWAFWGIARFGWSEATIGLTLAASGLVTAVIQGGLTGPTVKLLGEGRRPRWTDHRGGGGGGHGLAPGLMAVLVLLVIHGPEGFVHPALTALMSREAPPDAQGGPQGGIASLQSIAMLLGTVFFTQIFGYFHAGRCAPAAHAEHGFFVCAAMLVLSAGLLLRHGPPRS